MSALAVTLPSSDVTDVTVIKSLLIGALAGGLSAVMNFVVSALNTKKGCV